MAYVSPKWMELFNKRGTRAKLDTLRTALQSFKNAVEQKDEQVVNQSALLLNDLYQEIIFSGDGKASIMFATGLAKLLEIDNDLMNRGVQLVTFGGKLDDYTPTSRYSMSCGFTDGQAVSIKWEKGKPVELNPANYFVELAQSQTR